MNNRPKFAHEVRPLSVALIVPSMRMVVVDVWVDENLDEDGARAQGVQFYPVLGIDPRIERIFSKRISGDYPNTGGTEKDLLERGWYLQDQELKRSVVYIDQEYGLINSDDPMLDSSNIARHVVCCPWPPEQDEERLKPTVNVLVNMVLDRFKMRKRPWPLCATLHFSRSGTSQP